MLDASDPATSALSSLVPANSPPDEPPAELTINLRKPLRDIDGAETIALQLREPIVSELIQINEAPDGTSGIVAITLVTGGRYPWVGAMPARDFLRATAYLNRFVEPVPFVGDVPETLAIELLTPLVGPDGPIEKLTLHEPTAAELIKISNMRGMKGDLEALALIGAVREEILQNMGARDFTKAVGYIHAFFDVGQTAGAQS